MKSLKIKLSVCIVFIALTLSLSITSCHKENEVVEFDQMENPDKEKAEQGEDKPNEKMDTISITDIMSLKEENKLEKLPNEMRDKVQLRSQGRVKVIVTLKSIQCTNVGCGFNLM